MKPKGGLPFTHPLTNPLNAGNVVLLTGDGKVNVVYEIVLSGIRSNLQAHSISNTQTYTSVSPFV